MSGNTSICLQLDINVSQIPPEDIPDLIKKWEDKCSSVKKQIINELESASCVDTNMYAKVSNKI